MMRPVSERLMKKIFALILFTLLTLTVTAKVYAQTAESLWIQTDLTSLKTNEIVTVTVNAISATPVHGFTAQIRYDPACLQPTSGTSPIPGMNGLAVPQEAGLADVSFASPTPQIVNGVLAELSFTALKGCQTNIAIESAALVIRNESGYAAPLNGVSIRSDTISVSIDSAMGSAQPEQPTEGDVLKLTPNVSPASSSFNGWTVGLFSLGIIPIAFMLFAMFKLLKPARP